MKKLKLKPFAKVILLGMFVGISMISVFTLTSKPKTIKTTNIKDDFTYVNDYIFDSYYPVSNQEEKILKPYSIGNITIHKNFYEKDDSEELQQNSIVYHEGIYMQNSGVDYKSEEPFEVLASLSGTVTNVTEDPLLGKTIEIRNSTELIVMYQSLGEVSVKKGDTVTQGQIIGKSGTCSLNSDVKNGLHIEMYKNGQVINPEKNYEKKVTDLSDN